MLQRSREYQDQHDEPPLNHHKRNFQSASKCDQQEWKSASKPMTNTLKGITRDELRLVCVAQSGHCMICI